MSARVQFETQLLARCTPGCSTCRLLQGAALAIIGKAGSGSLSHEALEVEAGLAPGEAVRHYATVEACVLATYDRVCGELLGEFVEAFEFAASWDSALASAQRRVLLRLSTHLAEARLCFLEPVRGNRQLRRRRDLRRRWLVDFLTEQRRRLEPGPMTSRVQIELLIGATFQEIVTIVEAGRAAELTALGARFDELAALFEPSPRPPRLPAPV